MSQGFASSSTFTSPLPLSQGGTGTTTGAIAGVTDASSAAAGNIGQILSSVIDSGSPVSIGTASTATNMTSLSLTAGDWDVWGNMYITCSVTGTVWASWISSTSATLPDQAYRGQAVITGTALSPGVPMRQFNVSSTTTVYISGYCTFASGTCNMVGGIYARRRR